MSRGSGHTPPFVIRSHSLLGGRTHRHLRAAMAWFLYAFLVLPGHHLLSSRMPSLRFPGHGPRSGFSGFIHPRQVFVSILNHILMPSWHRSSFGNMPLLNLHPDGHTIVSLLSWIGNPLIWPFVFCRVFCTNPVIMFWFSVPTI